jgi:hypothetical protein
MRTRGTPIWLKRVALLLLISVGTSSAVSAQTSEATIGVVQAGERHADSVVNGALIGAGAGVASGLFLCKLTEPWEVCRHNVGPMLGFAAIGAGIGIGIDALIRKRKTDQPVVGAKELRAAPIVGRRAGGLQISLDF